jgi:bifunctional DNA-binding transcriptional regulator/antitoxin component of YhaV-PrlF toxin-antitoxin module
MSNEYNVFEGYVVEVCNNGDAILQFPDDLLLAMGWKEGDTLSIKEEDGKIIIKKID